MEDKEFILDRKEGILWLLESGKETLTEAQKIILLETLQIINDVLEQIDKSNS